MNLLTITVENPEEILNASGFEAGALVRVESCATVDGVYVEIGTVPVVAGTTLYRYYDQVAAAGTWYRTRYSDASDTFWSPYSTPFQAATSWTNYCSIHDAKQRLGITVADTTDDEELVQIISQTAGFIESKTGRPLYPDPVLIYTFDGAGAVDNGKTLLVPRGVRTVSAITHATTTGGTPVAVAATDYILRPLVQDRPPGWPATEIRLTDVAALPYWYPAYANVVVTGTFGWAAVPREIEAIALRLVINAWKLRGSGGADIVSVGVDGSRTFENALSWQDRKTLESYAGAPYVG